jgi:hypothetical protein
MTKKLPRSTQNFLNRYFIFRPGIIYAYSCLDPATRKREPWAYVGQTRQLLIARNNQHLGVEGYKGKAAKSQPWSDLYPQVRIVAEFKCPNIILDLVEKFYIKWKKPIYNHTHNLNNPRRIPLYQAQQDRKSRDYLRLRSRRGRVMM